MTLERTAWYTYFIRRNLPTRPLARFNALLNALLCTLARQPALLAKPWRRVLALRRLPH